MKAIMANETKEASKAIGRTIACILILCFRAWLLSLCASWLTPMIALEYWQWVVIVVTFRSLIAPPPSFDD